MRAQAPLAKQPFLPTSRTSLVLGASLRTQSDTAPVDTGNILLSALLTDAGLFPRPRQRQMGLRVLNGRIRENVLSNTQTEGDLQSPEVWHRLLLSISPG